MGVEKKPELSSSSNKLSKSNSVDIYRPPALRKIETYNHAEVSNNVTNHIPDAGAAASNKIQPQNCDNEITGTNVQSNTSQTTRTVRRERRPDRAVYIPRPRRSQTTPPQSNNAPSLISNDIPQINKTENGQRRINKEQQNQQSYIVGNNYNEENRVSTVSTSVISNCDSNKIQNDLSLLQQNKNTNSNFNQIDKNINSTLAKDCDNITQKQNSVDSTNLRNQKYTSMNHTKTNSLVSVNEENGKVLETSQIPRIEDAGLAEKDSREDREIKELERASKEINRTSRRIIKQTFNSDILEIPESLIPPNTCVDKQKTVDPENDDWDSMFDDNGECFDPKIISELTASVGKVKIETPKADYKAYHLKQSILNDEEFPHVLEVSNFPVEFKTQDLMMIFSTYKESGFDIKWVDDTHALAVFSSSRIAAEVLAMGHPFVLLKPLAEATVESRSKAKKCAASLQPYRPRPETCAALARRLVTGALGVRLKTAAEERENEKRVLREAKERKLLAAKQRDEIWES